LLLFATINGMYTFISLALFWFGAIFGSFAGAVTWRIKKKKDFVRGRSECEQCHHQLAALDLVPIFSWLLLKGKCRYCKKPIGVSALVAELVLGLAFMLSYLSWPLGFDGILNGLLFGLWLVALVLFMILSLYDMRWTLLPNKVMYPLIVVSLLFFAGRMLLDDMSLSTSVLELLYALTPIAGVYGALYVVSGGKWVGFGDVKLGVALGLLLGWQQALLALVLANLIGLVFVFPGLVRKKLDRTSHVPFGPFLIVAGVLAFLYGSYLINAYLSLVLV